MPRKMARQTLERHAGARYAGSRPYLGPGLLGSPENRYNLPHFRVHPGNPGSCLFHSWELKRARASAPRCSRPGRRRAAQGRGRGRAGGTAATVGVGHGVSGSGGSEPGRPRIPRRAYIFQKSPWMGLIAKAPSRGRCPPAVRGASGAAAQLVTLPPMATVQADKRK
jgi:hypothetical protein